MVSISIDLSQAKKVLDRAWNEIGTRKIPSPEISALLESVISSKDVTFKYILVTGLLGKCTDPKVHPRALQTASKLRGSYDARSLCHKVIVPFEKTKGDLWGLSNEPFVNKPARHPEHSSDNPQLRNSALAQQLHEVLEAANKSTPDAAFTMLVHALRLGKARAATRIVATVDIETTFRRVIDFTEQFLRESDGGTRLAALTGAFVALMNQGFTVKVYPPNFSDQFAKTVGDIEIHHRQHVVSAFECKDRAISLDDVNHGIRKATERGVSEYTFVAAMGLAVGQEDLIRGAIQGCKKLDLHLVDIREVVPCWSAALNPIRRKEVGARVADILRNDMKRAEVSNQAAELWNQLK